ncbi:hypothetical protein FOG50_00244 [Hanseniaspora uvarum]|nr:hypothetical protein FOG50_00244 [Hanseniaspora uvarum]
MKQVVIIKEETTEMSEKYSQLLKGLKKSEILDVINALQTKVTLDDDYKTPNAHAKKEILVESALSLISDNESNEDWNTIVKEIPYLNELEVSEKSESEEEEQKEEKSESEEEEETGCACGNNPEECECEDCNCEGCIKNDSCEDSCCFSYEPTLKERIQWKIYDFRWFLLLQNETLKSFCTSAAGLFKISTSLELIILFSYVYENINTLVYCPKITSHISNPHVLLVLKFLEILAGYIGIFVFVPFVISYYFNFLPEPIVEEDDDDELYDSESDEEYDDYVAPSDEDEEVGEVEEIEEEDASQEGEDLNDALVENGDEYDYEDLDEEYLGDSDIEDDYDYEDYPNLTLVDEPEKDQYDPFTYSLAKIAVSYICLRYGVGLCEFNNLVVLSKLCEVVIGFGIVGALIGLYN